MRGLHLSAKRTAILACALVAGGNTPPRAPTAHAGRGAQGPTVTAFEVNAGNLPAEGAFLHSRGFTVGVERELAQPVFGAFLGLPGAPAKQAVLTLGEQQLEVRAFSAPASSTAQPEHANDLGFEHIAIVVRDMNAAYARLQQSGAQLASVSPQTLPASNPVAGGVRAAYFRDPSGHFMELSQFPPAKGDKAWHRESAELFLGIDHSGIAVRRASESLRFYRDVLGLSVKSPSLNEGPEQEALSHVPGARVRITSQRGETGPGIELLEYVAPSGGQPFPGASAADAVHWEIVIRVAQLEPTLAARQSVGDMLSPDAPALAPAGALDTMAHHSIDWWLTAEDVGHRENRVKLAGDRIVLEYKLDNLYVFHGSFFPSSGAVNPSLTIIANALRVGDHLIDRLR